MTSLDDLIKTINSKMQEGKEIDKNVSLATRIQVQVTDILVKELESHNQGEILTAFMQVLAFYVWVYTENVENAKLASEILINTFTCLACSDKA